jgi:plasmid stabilization system protein ParE
MELAWTEKARVGLAEVEAFIAQDSPAKAQAFIDRLIRSIDRLRRFPYSGAAFLRDPSYRQVVIRRYRIVYRLGGDTILIVAVVAPGRDVRAIRQP